MPRRRKTGARGGSPEKQQPNGANNEPERGRTMSTSSDDGAGNAAAELGPKEREKLVEQLQEMFSKQLDPGVVYIVLAESDFKVEEAMEDLLMLACEADKNAKPGTGPSPTNVFSQIATELVSHKKHPSAHATKESKSEAERTSSSVPDASVAKPSADEEQASHTGTPPTSTAADSTAGYYSFYGAPLGFPAESRFSDPSVIAVGTIDYQASSKLAEDTSGKSPSREPGSSPSNHSKDCSVKDESIDPSLKDSCPTDHPSPKSRSFPVKLTSTSPDNEVNLQTDKELSRVQNLPSEYSLFGANNSPHVANGHHAHQAGTSRTSGGLDDSPMARLRQESNVAADFTFPATLRTDHEGHENKLLHRTSLANRKSVGADSPSTRMLKSKKPTLNLKIPFGDENTHIEIYSEIQTPLSPAVFDFDDEKPLSKPETPKVKNPISKAAMEAFQSFVETEGPTSQKDSFDSAEDSDDDAADILFSLPGSVRELSPSPVTTEESLQASNDAKQSERSQSPLEKTGVTDKSAMPNEETASNHSKSSNTETSSIPQSPTEEDNKDQSADVASKSSKSSSSCSSPDKSASAASKSPNLLFKILPRVMNYPSAASSPDTNVEADKEVAEIMEKAQSSKLSVDVPEFVPKQGNLLTPGDFVPPMVPAGHPVPYPSEYAMHFPHPAADPYWHPRFGMPVHPPFFPHPHRMHMYGAHVARFPHHIPMYPARPVVSSPIHPSMLKGGAGSPLVLPDGKSPQIPNENRLFGPPFVIQDTPYVLSDSPFPNQEANMSSKSGTKEEKKGSEVDRRVGSPLIMSDGKQESDTASEASTDDAKKEKNVATPVGKKVKTAGPKKLYVLRGCPGSGKSTLAKKLKGNKGVILSTDDFFMKKDKYEFDPSQLGDAHAWNKDRAELAMKVGMTPVIIDNTNTERWEMKPYVVLGVNYGYMIEIREPSTPWKFKAGELARRNSHGVSKETIKKMLDRYEKNVTVESIMKGMADQKIEQQRASKEAAKQATTSGGKNKEVAQAKAKQSSGSKGGKSVVTNKPSQDAAGSKPADSSWPFPVVLKDNKKANAKKNSKTKAKKKDAEEEWLKVTHGSRQKSPSPITTSVEKKQPSSKKSDIVGSKETSKADNKTTCKSNPKSNVPKEIKGEIVNNAAQEAASLLGLLSDSSDPVTAVSTVTSDEWDVGSSPKPQRDAHAKKGLDSCSQSQVEQKTSESPKTEDSVNVPITCDSSDVSSDQAVHDSSDDWGDNCRSAKPKRQTRKNRLAAVFNKTTVSSEVKDKALKENWSFPSHPDNKDGNGTDAETTTSPEGHQPDKDDLEGEVSTTEAATNTNPLYFSIVQRVQSGTPVGVVDDNVRILTGKVATSDVPTLPSEKPDTQEETKTSAVVPSSPKRQRLKLEKGCSTDDIPSERTHTGDLGFLQNCFPTVSVDDLRDFYEKCNHELEWTINLLLDSGIEYIEPTKSVHSTEDDGPSKSVTEQGKTKTATAASANVDEPQQSKPTHNHSEETTSAQEPTTVTSSTPDVNVMQIPTSINIFTGLLTGDVNDDDMYSSNQGTAVSTNEEHENNSSTPVQENGLDISVVESSKEEIQSSTSDTERCDFNENVASCKPNNQQPKCQIPVPYTFESDEEYESADEEVASDIDAVLLEAMKGSGLVPGAFVRHHSRQSSLSSLTSSILSSTDQEHLSSAETDQVPVDRTVVAASSQHNSLKEPIPVVRTQENDTAENKVATCVDSIEPSTGQSEDTIHQNTEKGVETCPKESEETSNLRETNRPSEGKVVGPTMSELALRMDPQFAKQLLEIFGPVGFHITPGSLSEEDLYVQVDYKTARRIHYKWMQTQKAKFDEQEEAMEAMEARIKEDEALARKLQEEEDFAVALQMKEKEEESVRHSRSSQVRSPVRSLAALSAEVGRRAARSPVTALTDIMDEQLALEVSKQEQAQSLGPRQDETLATKLKREKLFSMFPRLDKGVLEDIFSANGYQLDPTVNAVVVSDHMTAEPVRNVMSDAALKLYEDQLMEQARIQSQQEAVAQAQASSLPAIVVVDRPAGTFQETEEPDYEDFRTEATIHYKQRQECFQKAATAYHKGQKELAFYYAQQGHLHTDKLREANRRASEKILELKNAGLDQLNCLDLHGLHVNEAIDALKSVLQEKERELHHASPSRHPVANYICVITGRGNNSRGGVARIKPAVLNYLRTNDYRFTEPQIGLVKITLK